MAVRTSAALNGRFPQCLVHAATAMRLQTYTASAQSRHQAGRVSNACMQDDIVHDDLTVREQLAYSACLRGNRSATPSPQVPHVCWHCQLPTSPLCFVPFQGSGKACTIGPACCMFCMHSRAQHRVELVRRHRWWTRCCTCCTCAQCSTLWWALWSTAASGGPCSWLRLQLFHAGRRTVHDRNLDPQHLGLACWPAALLQLLLQG